MFLGKIRLILYSGITWRRRKLGLVTQKFLISHVTFRRPGMIVVVLFVFVVVQVGQLHLDRLDRGLVRGG